MKEFSVYAVLTQLGPPRPGAVPEVGEPFLVGLYEAHNSTQAIQQAMQVLLEQGDHVRMVYAKEEL